MANRTRSREKPTQSAAASQKSAPPLGLTANGRRTPKLSQADIAEMAQQMQIPDGMLQMLLDRYPELGKALTRRWALTARSNAA
jgi:hypothetical protein